MPSRNVQKVDAPKTYYHIYARGVSKQRIFNAPQDYHFFLSLFDRYLSAKPRKNSAGIVYPHFRDRVKLLAYCLMGNHFHMLIYQQEARAMAELMQCIMASYSRYFNRTYKRSGPLFESRYKASVVGNEVYLEHLSRYIHLNPRYWKRYPYSSFIYYLRGDQPEWLHTDQVLGMFKNPNEYAQFVADYEQNKIALEKIKHLLADR